MTQTVAIVGSGPSGFYCAEGLVKARPEIRVDLIDRLPTPFGLVRNGVAPDHQGIKNVWRVFTRTAVREAVRFVGNVELGRDVSLEELLGIYDTVVLATGVTVDRTLGIAGEHLPGVIGSRTLSAWYNGHPDYAAEAPELRGKGIAVIGNGNVAVDVVRVLARTRPEMVATDIPDYAMAAIEAAPYEDLYMLGRRGPVEASFTTAELRELGAMAETVALVDPEQLPETVHVPDPKQQKLKEKIVDTLRGYSENKPGDKPKRLHMKFFASPTRILGEDRVTGLEVSVNRLEDGRAVPTGDTYTLDVGTVITAIGFFAKPMEGVALSNWRSSYENDEGKIRDRLFCVGWAKRGPSGVIATNRKDSVAVANQILEELHDHPEFEGGEALDKLLEERGVAATTFADWERIDAVEQAAASEEAPRAKLTSFDALLEAARSKPSDPSAAGEA